MISGTSDYARDPCLVAAQWLSVAEFVQESHGLYETRDTSLVAAKGHRP
jgi:hypothetical protein